MSSSNLFSFKLLLVHLQTECFISVGVAYSLCTLQLSCKGRVFEFQPFYLILLLEVSFFCFVNSLLLLLSLLFQLLQLLLSSKLRSSHLLEQSFIILQFVLLNQVGLFKFIESSFEQLELGILELQLLLALNELDFQHVSFVLSGSLLVLRLHFFPFQPFNFADHPSLKKPLLEQHFI